MMNILYSIYSYFRLTAVVSIFPILCFLFAFSAQSQAQSSIPSVTILADPSLVLPITEIARNYARTHQVSVSTSFGPGKVQSVLIGEGIEADVFISARSRYITELQNRGLIDVYSRTSLAKNRLVLAGSRAFTTEIAIQSPAALDSLLAYNPDFIFALGDAESVPSGSYGLDALYNMNWLERVEPFLALPRSTSQLASIIKDNNFGLLYATTALLIPEIKTIAYIPEDTHKPIIYQGVVVAGANINSAKDFLNHLRSDTAQQIFKKYGFL